MIREIKEEINLNVIDYTYNDNEYYQPSNTLMHNYAVIVDSENFKLTNEVDEAHWYSIEESRKEIKTRLSCSFIFRKIFKKTALAVFLIQIFSICFNDFFIPIKMNPF